MGYYNKECIDESLKMLEINDTGKKPVKSFSLGMKQRLGIARAILSKPDLLILDEPTNGLDPAGIKQIRNLMKMLCEDFGMTIMISSHILSEIENVADTIGIINHGKLEKEISMKEISESNLAFIELQASDTKYTAYILSDKLNLVNFKITEENKIRIYDLNVTSRELSKALAQNNVDIISFGRKAETLEDYFLKVTGEV